MTLEAVAKIAEGFPGVTVGRKWNNKTWMVRGKGFAWVRPFSKADLTRGTPPPGDIIAIAVENLDAKEALLGLPGFFTIPHFDGYPAVLVALRQARVKDVRAVLTEAYRRLL